MNEILSKEKLRTCQMCGNSLEPQDLRPLIPHEYAQLITQWAFFLLAISAIVYLAHAFGRRDYDEIFSESYADLERMAKEDSRVSELLLWSLDDDEKVSLDEYDIIAKMYHSRATDRMRRRLSDPTRTVEL